MTGFEIYLLIYFVLNIGGAMGILALGPVQYGPAAALLAIVWGIVNVWLLLTIGVG